MDPKCLTVPVHAGKPQYAPHGKDKLLKALETAEPLLKKKGIPFDAEEINLMIGTAVAKLKEAFCKPLEPADTANAVRSVESDDVPVRNF